MDCTEKQKQKAKGKTQKCKDKEGELLVSGFIYYLVIL